MHTCCTILIFYKSKSNLFRREYNEVARVLPQTDDEGAFSAFSKRMNGEFSTMTKRLGHYCGDLSVL